MFLGPCPVGLEVNHIDGDKRNNRVANLEYVTRSENHLHAHRLGLCKSPAIKGSDHANAILTDNQVLAIRKQAQTMTYQQVADEFGVCRSCVGQIARGTAWKHLGGPRRPRNRTVHTTGAAV